MHRYSIRHPWRVLLPALLVCLAAAPGLTRLQLRTDGNALVPASAPEVQSDHAVRDEFGVRDWIIVVIESDDPAGIFNSHTLGLIVKWTELFGGVEGLEPHHVISLATEKTDRVFPGTLRQRGFLNPFPQTPADLDQLRADLERIRLYTGTIVSYDGSAAAILIGVRARADAGASTRMDRSRYYEALREIIAAEGSIPEKVSVVGAPVAESLLGMHILDDLGVPTCLTGRLPGRYDGAEVREGDVTSSLYRVQVFIARHIGLVPIALGVIAAVFLVAYRSPVLTFLPLLKVGACLVFVFGLMGWLEVPIYLTITVMPVILTATGITDEIHVFSRYRQLGRERPADGSGAITQRTWDELWRATVKTSITTAVGFLSFGLSPLAPVQAFGFFTAIGVLFCMFWVMSVTPACLALCSIRRVRAGAAPFSPSVASVPDVPLGVEAPPAPAGSGLARIVTRRRYVVLALGLAVLVSASLGARRVIVQDSWVDSFAPNSEFFQATQTVNRLFHGTHILLVRVDAGDEVITGQVMSGHLDTFKADLPVSPDIDPSRLVEHWVRIVPPTNPPAEVTTKPSPYVRPVRMARIASAAHRGDSLTITINSLEGTLRPLPYYGPNEVCNFEIRPRRMLLPEVLGRIAELEAFIEEHREEAVGRVLGPADYVETTNYMMGGQREPRRCIPDDAATVRFIWQQYERVRGVHRYREIITPEQSGALLTVFLKDADYVRTRRLLDDLREYERTQLAPHGLSLSFAGDVAVSQALIDAIVTTQVRSLALSLFGILAITVILGRSFGLGLYCAVPCGIAVLVNFAIMGWFEVPLGVATSMFSAMTLGIGVDYAIHLTERYRSAAGRGRSHIAALTDALRVTAPANALDTLAVGLGFGVLLLSQVPANARLGGLVILSVVNCLLGSLVLLPALLSVWRPAVLRPRAAISG